VVTGERTCPAHTMYPAALQRRRGAGSGDGRAHCPARTMYPAALQRRRGPGVVTGERTVPCSPVTTPGPPHHCARLRRAPCGPPPIVQPGMRRLAKRDGRRARFRPRLRTQRTNPAPFAGDSHRTQAGVAWHMACGRTGVRVRWVASYLRACHHRATRHPSTNLSAPRVPREPGASRFLGEPQGPARLASVRGGPAGRSPSRARAPSRTSRAGTGPRPARAACHAGRPAARAAERRCPGEPRPSAVR
jgi:hypothetical protein